jgi:NitT/TauT family transport system substrate-binding protein
MPMVFAPRRFGGVVAPLLSALLWLAAGCGASGAPRSAAPPQPPPSAAAPASPAADASAPAGAPAGAPAPAPLAAPIKVRMGSNDSVVNGPIYIALDRHYFADVGLDVEDIRFGAASQMMQPLAAGQLDVVPSAISAGLFNALARDIDVRLVAGRETATRGFGIFGVVARQDLWDSGAVRTLADLRGRKVAIAGANAGSTLQMALARGLERQGMSLADLDVVDIPYPDTNAALANGSVDAAMQLEPLLTQGTANGSFSVLARADELYPDQQASFILYSADFARNHADAGRRWMVAYLRGVRDFMDAFTRDRDYDDVVGILTRNTRVKDPAIYRQMIAGYINPNGYIDPSGLAEEQEWFATNGFVPQRVDVLAKIDNQFVDYALSVLGEAQ